MKSGKSHLLIRHQLQHLYQPDGLRIPGQREALYPRVDQELVRCADRAKPIPIIKTGLSFRLPSS